MISSPWSHDLMISMSCHNKETERERDRVPFWRIHCTIHGERGLPICTFCFDVFSNEHFISSVSFNDWLSCVIVTRWSSCNLFISSFSSSIFDWRVKHSFDFTSKSVDNWAYKRSKYLFRWLRNTAIEWIIYGQYTDSIRTSVTWFEVCSNSQLWIQISHLIWLTTDNWQLRESLFLEE